MTLSPSNTRRLRAHQLAGGTLASFVPEPTVRRRNLESEMQRGLIRWWAANCKQFGVPEQLLFSIPNGFNADAKRGSIMKAEGQRRGAPDLMLAVVRSWRPSKTESTAARDTHALFLELKTPSGVVSPEQAAFHTALSAQDYKVVVVRTLAECINQITAYLAK